MARIGEAASLSFTLTYAPPEAARALQQERTAIASCTSHDAWSVGVIGYELITGRAALDVASEGIDRVRALHLLYMRKMPLVIVRSFHALVLYM